MKYLLIFSVLMAAACGHKKVNEAKAPAPKVYTKASDVPLEDFFRNPAMFGARISPDGKSVATLRPWKNRMNVFVQPLEDAGKIRQITFIEERDIHEVHWKGNDVLLYERDTNGDENFHVFAVNVKTGTLKDLTPFPSTRASLADDLEEVSDTDVLIAHNQRDKEVFDIYRVNVLTGESNLTAKNEHKIDNWLIDHAGTVRGGRATDGVNSIFYFEKSPGKGFEAVFKTGFKNEFTPIGFTADNKRIYAMTNLGRNLTAVAEFDPRKPIKANAGKILYTHPRYDTSGATYSEVRKSLSTVTVVTDRRETVFLHPDDKKDWEYLKGELKSIVLANSSRDEKYWVVKTMSDVSGGAYYVFDRPAKKITPIGEVMPWIPSALMAEMKTINYKTRDGLTVEGYLTIPRGREAKNLPVVVNPHGGPWARDEWHYDSEAQFLASRGYAVFQMNYRGSTGYGRKFWEASFKQWGKKMQDDITDGVKWLIQQGYANEKKICIYGASYGGYATLAGVTFTPDLYACAVDYVGVSNMFTFMKTIPPYWKPFLEMMYQMVGHPEKDKELLRAASPVFFVDKIKAPLFVAQGANDPRVNKDESDQIVEGLRKRGVEVEYMVKENEGHGFHNEENRFDFYRAMESFLAKHL